MTDTDIESGKTLQESKTTAISLARQYLHLMPSTRCERLKISSYSKLK